MHNESWVKVEPFLINNNIEVEGMFDRPYYNIKHYNDHHLCHAACAFYHSGFEESLIFVIDRNGSQVQSEYSLSVKDVIRESETVFIAQQPDKFKAIDRKFWTYKKGKIFHDGALHKLETHMSMVKVYESATNLLGFHPLENGKTMGLAAYGNINYAFPSFFRNNRLQDKFFTTRYTNGDTDLSIHAKEDILFLGFNANQKGQMNENNFQIYADYAFHVQRETQEELVRRVEYWVQKTNIKKVAIVGGYGLNVVANGELVKRFPDVDFFFEPLSDDTGISLGIAYIKIKASNKYFPIPPMSHTFFQGLGSTYPDNIFYGEDCRIKDIASLIKDQKTVAVYCGKSEAGPRALGHRSILFDATNPDAKTIVNKIKNREWFRPFAAMVLEEDFEYYFQTHGLKSAEYMTISFDVTTDKIPGVTHVDNSCRVQTVNKNIPHIYDLLKYLKEDNQVPVLLNTSLNLAGDPLIETVEEAIDMFNRSDLHALWFPELNRILIKG